MSPILTHLEQLRFPAQGSLAKSGLTTTYHQDLVGKSPVNLISGSPVRVGAYLSNFSARGWSALGSFR